MSQLDGVKKMILRELTSNWSGLETAKTLQLKISQHPIILNTSILELLEAGLIVEHPDAGLKIVSPLTPRRIDVDRQLQQEC